jgi:hypothetical protein
MKFSKSNFLISFYSSRHFLLLKIFSGKLHIVSDFRYYIKQESFKWASATKHGGQNLCALPELAKDKVVQQAKKSGSWK